MTGCAGIWNVIALGHLGGDEAESMRMNKSIPRTFGFYLWHMTRNALASRGSRLVVRMLFQRGGPGSVGRKRTVTV